MRRTGMEPTVDITRAPFRDPRYATPEVRITPTAEGGVLIANPRPYSTEHLTMASALTHWAACAPDRTWLAERSGMGWRRVTYGEAHQRVRALAGGLREIGLAPGGRPLLVMARNGIDHALVAYAAMSQGVPVAPVSHRYGMSGANRMRLTLVADKVRPAAVYAEDPQMLAHGLSVQALAGLPVIAGRNGGGTDVALERLLHATPADFVAKPDHHARYLLTSGSTGVPKAVVCRHREVSINVAQVTACFDDPEPPVMLHSAPWNHSMGLSTGLHQSLHRGGTLYIDTGQPTPQGFGETVRNLRDVAPTYHNMVPAGWTMLADALEQDTELARNFFSRVRLLQYGGAAMGQAVADRIQAVAVATVGERISFASAYGATETGPIVCNVHWTNTTMGGVGLPIPGTQVKLTPMDGKLELRVKGPQISQGYLDDPERTAAAFDGDGFYRLGDAARFADPQDPMRGLSFDGRLAENFKLLSGTFVSVNDVRLAALDAIGEAVTDAVVCGEAEAGVGLLLYPNPDWSAGDVRAAAEAGLAQLNRSASGGTSCIMRALVLPGPPDPQTGEVTDKNSIAQGPARAARADDVRRLFATAPSQDVIVLR
jgi:feruloyl-CoA synthase